MMLTIIILVAGQVAARTEESLGFDKPSFVFDHSEV